MVPVQIEHPLQGVVLVVQFPLLQLQFVQVLVSGQYFVHLHQEIGETVERDRVLLVGIYQLEQLDQCFDVRVVLLADRFSLPKHIQHYQAELSQVNNILVK